MQRRRPVLKWFARIAPGSSLTSTSTTSTCGFTRGETPFKCPVCNKGFRDSKKMRVHIGRHKTNNLKCQICPEVLESAKAFEKHLLQSHHNNAVTQLHVSTSGGGSGDITDLTSPALSSILSSSDADLSPLVSSSSISQEESATTVSLSVDELIQYAQPVQAGGAAPAPIPVRTKQQHPELEDRYVAGSKCKFKSVSMDEFVFDSKLNTSMNSSHNDSSEFPGLVGIRQQFCHHLRSVQQVCRRIRTASSSTAAGRASRTTSATRTSAGRGRRGRADVCHVVWPR